MKNILYSILALFIVGDLFGHTIVPPELRSLKSVASYFINFEKRNDYFPSRWEELYEQFGDFSPIESPMIKVSHPTDFFIIIPKDQGEKFAKGRLLLVGAQSSEWPHHWKTNEEVPEGDISQEIADKIKATKAREKDIRYVLYLNGDTNRVDATYLYESDFQDEIKSSGIIIPEPSSFYPSNTLFDEYLVGTWHNKPKLDQSKAEPIEKISQISEPAPKENSTEELEEQPSSQTLPWVLGILILLTVVGFTLRSRKNS